MLYTNPILLLLTFQPLVALGAPPRTQNTHVEVKLTGEEMVEAGTLLMEKLPDIKKGMKVMAKKRAKHKVAKIPIFGKLIRKKAKKKAPAKEKETLLEDTDDENINEEDSFDEDGSEAEVGKDYSVIHHKSQKPTEEETLKDGVIGYKISQNFKGMSIPKKK